jgi:predicted amino acid dehydrogenase
VINDAYNVTVSISTMDMLPNLRAQFIKNKEVITGIKNQIFDATASTTEKFGRSAGELAGKVRSGTSSGGSSGSSGCYIATMAYGDYDHPQVMILRQFRDEVLDKSAFGKWFIKTYYHYSPRLVERLKNQRTVNIIIRKALNQFINLIK